MEELYNVYSWRYLPDGGRTTSKRVGTGVNFTLADTMVQSYLDLGDEWDAFAVKQLEDPEWDR